MLEPSNFRNVVGLCCASLHLKVVLLTRVGNRFCEAIKIKKNLDKVNMTLAKLLTKQKVSNSNCLLLA